MREGLMMDDYPLSLTAVVQRAERFSADKAVVFRRPDGSAGRSTFGACTERARRLAGALAQLGIRPGDPVATLLWNQPEHLELYFAVPSMGGSTRSTRVCPPTSSVSSSTTRRTARSSSTSRCWTSSRHFAMPDPLIT